MQKQEMDLSREYEVSPKAIVHFHGIHHFPYNLQAIEHIIPAVVSVFERTRGKRTFLMEHFGLSHKGARFNEDLIRREGFRNFFVGLDSTLFDRTLFERLHQVQEQFDFEFRFESHSDAVHRSLLAFDGQIIRYSEQTQGAWKQKNFTKAIEGVELVVGVLRREKPYREREGVEELKELAKKLLRNPAGGAIFLLFGGTHESLLNPLERRFNHGEPIIFDRTIFLPAGWPREEIYRRIDRNEPIPEVLHARDLLFSMMQGELFSFFNNKGDLNFFSAHFEEIIGEVIQVVNALSLEEIRKICEEGEDVVTLWQKYSKI